MKILSYQILEADDVFCLEKLVNDVIKTGWQPQGGVCILKSAEGSWINYQAMILPAPETADLTAQESDTPTTSEIIQLNRQFNMVTNPVASIEPSENMYVFISDRGSYFDIRNNKNGNSASPMKFKTYQIAKTYAEKMGCIVIT